MTVTYLLICIRVWREALKFAATFEKRIPLFPKNNRKKRGIYF